ncbi:MAG: Flagellar hook-basal body complex protein FliE [Synergistales bacterium 53_16]|nr:MAG: Flagellar hook-basal body complex protein FliE [Synergistales bacterium 53_16]
MRSSMVDLSLLGNARTAYGNSAVRGPRGAGAAQVVEKESDDKVQGFEQALKQGLERVNDVQVRAESAMKAMATGDVDDISEVAAAVSEADLALQLAVQIRDKLLDAYNRLVQMPL